MRGLPRLTAALLLASLSALAPAARAAGEPAPPAAAPARASVVRVHKDEAGFSLQVDGKDLMVRGMNWGYTPIGENYRYSLWVQPDEYIRLVLDRDMGMLREMGVNAIRQFDDIPPRWVSYIHGRFGIYTVVNPLMGRYGTQVEGTLVPNTDYGNPAHRRAILADLKAKLERYRGVPGVLLWMLGNENNYGLHWTSFEIQALPGQEDAARAESLYSLMGEAAALVKQLDPDHPVMIANGDVQYLDLIAKHAPALDIFGANVYRGPSARDLFDVVKAKLDRPVLFTEFGADAYDARAGREDHVAQAEYLRKQWEEIYSQARGQKRAGNALGGFVFQWVDGWWKTGQESNLAVHDTSATWPNEGYPLDFEPGQNNMNEEWFGICALGPPDERGVARLQPRTAYYVLQAAWRLDPYAPATDADAVAAHFAGIQTQSLSRGYDATQALAKAEELSAVRVSNLRLFLDSSGSRGSVATARSNQLTVDHTESIYFDLMMRPTSSVRARAAFNVLGNVAQNRLNGIFYETRGRATTPQLPPAAGAPVTPGSQVTGTPGQPASALLDRFALYQADFEVDQADFKLEGFYRTGHYHWGDEGDLFGLYREANYGPSLDIYNGNAPFGVVLTGKKGFSGVKVAVGPELFWGANPSAIAKVRQAFGAVNLTLVHQEDITRGGTQLQTASVIRERVARRTALSAAWASGPLSVDAGLLMAAPQRVGESFTWTRRASGRGYMGTGYDVLEDRVGWLDTLAVKARITYDLGLARFYLQPSFRGLVADSGGEPNALVTGWTLRESGRGNHYGGQAGVALQFGTLQVAPSLLYQRPLVGPNPTLPDAYDAATQTYFPGVRPRNVMTDAFAVLDNRETRGAELLLTYDPTPGTWFYAWDRDMREDAPFALSLDLVYRNQPTSRDATIAILANGSAVPFGRAPPPRDEWDATLRGVVNVSPSVRLFGNAYVASNQAGGEDARQVLRKGANLSLAWATVLLTSRLQLDDWGPYDYHRVFNLTYPLQAAGELSYGLTRPVFGTIDTRFGVRGLVRNLDQYSEGIRPEAIAERRGGQELEVGAFAVLSL